MSHAPRSPRSLSLLLGVALLLAASVAAAQGTARSTCIDASAISSGMGGASAAVFWSAEPSDWANPALLGYHRGLRYRYGHSQLVPGLAEDVDLTSNRLLAAFHGVGIVAGGTELDYGLSRLVDEEGDRVGFYRSQESYSVLGAGVSLSGLARGFAPGSRLARVGRDFDVAVGVTRKHMEVELSPAWLFGRGSGNALDLGLLVRGGRDLVPPGSPGRLPLRLDLGFGASVLNSGEEEIEFGTVGYSAPPTRMRRLGGSARLAAGPPASWSEAPRSAALWLRGLDPLVSLGVAYDDECVGTHGRPHGYDVQHFGVELAAANVLALRFGHVTDRAGEIEDYTFGVGVGLPLAGVAGLRYDYARYPQATSLPDVTRHTFSMWLDALALRRLMDGDDPAGDGR